MLLACCLIVFQAKGNPNPNPYLSFIIRTFNYTNNPLWNPEYIRLLLDDRSHRLYIIVAAVLSFLFIYLFILIRLVSPYFLSRNYLWA